MRLARVSAEGRWLMASVGADSELELLPEHLGLPDDYVRGDVDHRQRVSDAIGSGRIIAASAVKFGAPLAVFNRDVLCTGWNYWDHFEESEGKREGQDPPARPEHPVFFTKGPDSVIGPFDDIYYDARISSKWDYEAEIVLVIGKEGRSIPEERAWEHIAGFCLANDVSQRDLQRAHGGQWLKGKSIDHGTPVGPWLTTVDEIHDATALEIGCELNGERMQQATVGQMAFPFERLIAELSWGMTLRAGDILLTGTPSGIGNARDPQVFLKPGDVVTTVGGALGTMRNTVVEHPLS